jgi:hypothetical protein
MASVPRSFPPRCRCLRPPARRFGLDLSFDYDDVGFTSLEKHGTTLRESVLEKARQDYDGVILGTQSHADYPAPEKGGRNVSAGFRIGLDLYANVRPARTRSFIPSNMKPGKTMDLVIMREATEGFYPDRNMHLGWAELMPSPDMAISLRKITAHCSNRIARRAFELAMKRRKKVTAVHKVNSFHQTDGLFPARGQEGRGGFPEVPGRPADRRLDGASRAQPRALRRDLRDEFLRRHHLGSGERIVGQPRPRRLDDGERQPLLRPGPARLGARHPEPGQGQPGLDDAVLRHAAAMARRDARPSAIRGGIPRHRRSDRHRPDGSGLPHAGPRRQGRGTKKFGSLVRSAAPRSSTRSRPTRCMAVGSRSRTA